jgi:hypothetical protein
MMVAPGRSTAIRVAALIGLCGASRGEDPSVRVDVAIQTEEQDQRHAALATRIATAPTRVMKGPGLAGATGGIQVKVLYPLPQEVILPIPQLAGGQAPISLFVRCDPRNAVTEYRLWNRGDGNVVLRVKLVGKPQDVRIEWSSVVLLTANDAVPPDSPDAFRSASACVQSQSVEIRKLADELWPASGKMAAFAANIQKHVRQMKRVDRPRSLDALGILKSGENSICTANANLAAALLRSKGIACRSLAVIPPNGMKLEMHRVVEFLSDGGWTAFDPSSLSADVPAKPWQNVVMARTTIDDEDAAMKPRMGVMIGCPYGQELELLTPGVMLSGQDFFWTTAKPLAEFSPSPETFATAKERWETFLKGGFLSTAQIDAGSAQTAQEFADTLRQ